MLSYGRHRVSSWLIIASWACAPADQTAASWVPWAETVTSIETWVGLGGSQPAPGVDSSSTMTSRTQTAAVTLSQTVLAIQKSLGLPPTASNESVVHYAASTIDLAVATRVPANVGELITADASLVRFTVNGATWTAMSAAEPMFSRASAVSEGILEGSVIKNPGPAWLDVVWDIQRLELAATSNGAMAFVSERIEVFSLTPAGKQSIAEAGLVSWLTNGNAILRLFNGTDSYTGQAMVGDRLELSPARTAVTLPLPPQIDALAIRVLSTHTEISVAAAPRATIPVLAGAGNLYGPAQATPMMHWNAAAGTLDFDPIPVIWHQGALTLAPQDPLKDGEMEISGLHYVGSSDGRRYFTGGVVTLRDRFGIALLTVSLPMLVFEDSLFSHQGFTGFAPLLQVLATDLNRSAWVDEFLDLMTLDASYIPELFIGLNGLSLTDARWDSSFSVPIKALVSFAGAAAELDLPVPATVSLCGIGALLIAVRRRRRAAAPLRGCGGRPTQVGRQSRNDTGLSLTADCNTH